MEVRNSHFTAFIDVFTGNTYIMIIVATSSSGAEPVSTSKVPTALIQINIAAARKHFEKFIPESA